jgi:hypothetical protein
LTQFTEGVPISPGGSLTAEQASVDAADLRTAIGELAGLVAGSRGLPALLAEVAAFAVHAIPGADGAGVTLLRVDRADNMVEALGASAPFVAEIDHIQYVTLHEGPCINAALERRTVRSGSLGGEKIGRGGRRNSQRCGGPNHGDVGPGSLPAGLQSAKPLRARDVPRVGGLLTLGLFPWPRQEAW